ncbi:MAG: hypothetical protein ACPL4C_04960 [Brevinematia bacterium]
MVGRSFFKIVVFLLSLLFIFISSFVSILEAQMVSSDILYLREISERGVSLFIAGDYENALIQISNAIDFSKSLLIKLSNEGQEFGKVVDLRDVDYVPSKSELITSIRKFTAESVKYYVLGNINESAKRIVAIQNILIIVQDKCIESMNSLKGFNRSSDIVNKNPLYREKEVLKEIASLKKNVFRPTVVEKYIVVTNRVVEEKVIKEDFFSNYFFAFLGFGVLLVILITFSVVRFFVLRKRVKDLSDIV